MRNLNLELKEFGLDWAQRECVLQWVNTLTNQDLFDNGSQNACFVAGDGDYCDEPSLTKEQVIEKWVRENSHKYLYIPNGKIKLVRFIKAEFNITLKEAIDAVEKNW